MAADTVGCLTPHSRAAALKEPSLAAAAAYLKAGIECIGINYICIGSKGIVWIRTDFYNGYVSNITTDTNQRDSTCATLKSFATP